MPTDPVARWRLLLGRVAVIMELVEEAHRRSRSMVELLWQYPFTATVSRSLLEQDGLATTPTTAPHVRAKGCYPMKPENCDHPPTSLYKYGNASGKFRECRQCGTNWRAQDVLNPVDGSVIELFEFRMVRARPGHSEPRPSTGVGYTYASTATPVPKHKAKATATSPSYSATSARMPPSSTTTEMSEDDFQLIQ
jgi:hypothetical protein